MRHLGYVEGRNVILEWRLSEGKAERFPELAADLVRAKVDVIVASDNPAIAAAQKATGTIPIVMVTPQDPVASRFVRSLAQPGGNLTGLSGMGTDVQGKVPQFLKEALPGATRVAILWVPTEPDRQVQLKAAQDAARALGLQVQAFELRDAGDLDRLFATMGREKMDALIVHPSQATFAHRRRIAELAAKHRLPSIGPIAWFVEAGGLLAFGAKDSEKYGRAADYVDKILRGARPAELPIEQVMRFDLKVNLKTAKSLGVTVPPSLLLRASLVVQ